MPPRCVRIIYYFNFIEEGSSRHELESQLARIVHTGDPVWRELAGDVFSTSGDRIDSFNVYNDDSETIQHELELFLSENCTADMLIVHSLLVDHSAHKSDTSSPVHPAIHAALLQLNRHLQYVTTHLPNDTLLFVFGDHGLSHKGNHGGSTLEETTTGLCVVSRSISLDPFDVFGFGFLFLSVA